MQDGEDNRIIIKVIYIKTHIINHWLVSVLAYNNLIISQNLFYSITSQTILYINKYV